MEVAVVGAADEVAHASHRAISHDPHRLARADRAQVPRLAAEVISDLGDRREPIAALQARHLAGLDFIERVIATHEQQPQGRVLHRAVFGSLVAFTGYAWLLRNARPVVATSYAYVNPILAVLLGAALYGEPLSWTTALANILIVGAVMLALTRRT